MSVGVESYVRRATKLRLVAGDVPLWMKLHPRGSYIIASILSAPLWIKESDFRELRAEANWKTQSRGERYVLDHEIPIQHPYVCGLTVPWNMKVVPGRVNATKSNNWNPDQITLDLPEPSPQLTFWR